ncbi:hypothetical protein D3C80_1887590 [compost metagenome]
MLDGATDRGELRGVNIVSPARPFRRVHVPFLAAPRRDVFQPSIIAVLVRPLAPSKRVLPDRMDKTAANSSDDIFFERNFAGVFIDGNGIEDLTNFLAHAAPPIWWRWHDFHFRYSMKDMLPS